MDPIVGTALQVGGDLLGGYLSGQSASAESRKQRQWATRQYAKRYQVTVKDLQAAGLNPMLAYMGQGGVGAGSVPSGSAAPGADYKGIGTRGYSAFQAAQLLKSQQSNLQADTALKGATAVKTAAEAKVIQDQGLFSAESAERGRDKIGFEVAKLQEEIESIRQSRTSQQIDIETLKPLAAEYQRIVNQAARLGISEQQATSDFWKDIGEYGKIATFLKMLVGGRSGPR